MMIKNPRSIVISGLFLLAACALASGQMKPSVDLSDGRSPSTPSDGSFEFDPLPTASIPVFPGAEGFGAFGLGGRGAPNSTPRVMFVTTLEDKIWNDSTGQFVTAPGSLRAALEASGPRFVIFKVGGTIVLNQTIRINYPYIYVAGQTAPPPGITIAHHGVVVRTNDVVLRYLRFRAYFDEALDYLKGRYMQCLTLDRNGNQAQVAAVHTVSNVVVDHCSFSWSIDDMVGIGDFVEEATIQNCIISESSQFGNELGPEGLGMLCTAYNGGVAPTNLAKISLHHNIMAHNVSRNPRMNAGSFHDIRNNIVYNWGEARPASMECGATVNFVENAYYMGMDSPRGNLNVKEIMQVTAPTDPLGLTKLYMQNNLAPLRLNNQQDDWNVGVSYFILNDGHICSPGTYYCQFQLNTPALQAPYRLATPGAAPLVTTLPVATMTSVVLNTAGASGRYRDGVDQRMCDELAYVVANNPVALMPPGYNPYTDPKLRAVGPHDGQRCDVLWFRPTTDPGGQCMPRQARILPGQTVDQAKRAMLSRMTCTFSDGLRLPQNLEQIIQNTVQYRFDVITRIIPDRSLIEGMYPANTSAVLPSDRDQDGIPDYYELQIGTDPNRPDSMGDINRDGYLNIENYLNSLVG